jgi:zinc protease
VAMAPSNDLRARDRDAAIVRRCRIGDETAWTELVERFSPYICAILTRGFELDRAAAEDVFQDVFTRAFRRLDTLSDDRALKPWLAQLTRRAAIDRLRATRADVGLDAVLDPGGLDPALEPIEEAVSVHRALAELPEPYRDVVERFFIRDQSYRMIAAECGLPPGTTASRISRGLAMLRERLEGSTKLVA